jgi:hypothetical protein
VGGRFKTAFAKRDRKQTIIDLREISTNWFERPVPPLLWALSVQMAHQIFVRLPNNVVFECMDIIYETSSYQI